MKYTKEITERIVTQYQAGTSVKMLALELQVPERSIIAKLSSIGVYKKKQYQNKQGETPVKKAELIETLSNLLELDIELCESLEKVNKLVLTKIISKLQQTSVEC